MRNSKGIVSKATKQTNKQTNKKKHQTKLLTKTPHTRPTSRMVGTTLKRRALIMKLMPLNWRRERNEMSV